MPLTPARDTAETLETLHRRTSRTVPNPLVYANYSDWVIPAWRRWALCVAATRTLDFPPIELIRLPPGTLVDAGQSFLTLAGSALIQEQAAPWIEDLPAAAQRMRERAPHAIDIDEPCLLLSRFGETTWGHWIAEIFINACLVETRYPGRFRVVVPAHTTEPTPDRTFSTSVLESLHAIGVGTDRLIRIEKGCLYRFAQLHTVSGAWSDTLHPDALTVLRSIAAAPAAPAPRRIAPRRIAALRKPDAKRGLLNLSDLAATLQAHECTELDLQRLPFTDQLRAFRDAELIVASLGSDCTGALFAPLGARIVTVAPLGWADFYFTPSFQSLHLRHADVRGASTLFATKGIGAAPHTVDPLRLAEGLTAVLAATPIQDGRTLTIDGDRTPLLLTAPLLELDFEKGGSAHPYCEEGWSWPQKRIRWSVGRQSTIVLPPSLLPPGDLWLRIEGSGGPTSPRLAPRPLAVRANGTLLGEFEMTANTHAHLLIPAAARAVAPELRLVFDHPACPSPHDLGLSGNQRPLGFGFTRLTFFRSGTDSTGG